MQGLHLEQSADGSSSEDSDGDSVETWPADTLHGYTPAVSDILHMSARALRTLCHFHELPTALATTILRHQLAEHFHPGEVGHLAAHPRGCGARCIAELGHTSAMIPPAPRHALVWVSARWRWGRGVRAAPSVTARGGLPWSIRPDRSPCISRGSVRVDVTWLRVECPCRATPRDRSDLGGRVFSSRRGAG